MSPGAKKGLSLAVSVGILALIYWRIDAAAMLAVFRRSSAAWLAASLAMVVPLTLLTAHRLRVLTPRTVGLSLGEALSLTLAASVLNMVLPSKMGDVAKSWFMTERGRLGGGMALALVAYEKGWDMLALLAWCALGLVVLRRDEPLFALLAVAVSGGALLLLLVLGSARVADLAFRAVAAAAPAGVARRLAPLREGWHAMRQSFRDAPGRLLYVATASLALWFLHLLQIWMFTVALRAAVPLLASLALAPLAILAGLLPLTFAGVGSRDGALIVLFRDYLDPPTGAALGLLATMRYLMPALAGLPFLQRYVARRPAGAGGSPPSYGPAGGAERRRSIDITPSS